MDFVVAGFGFGAAIILLGFVIRDLGPLFRRARLAEPAAGRRIEWKRLCHEVGASLIGGGLALCLTTLVPLLLGASDAAGGRIVLVASGLLAAVISLRTVQSVHRYRIRTVEPPAWTPVTTRPSVRQVRDPAAAWPAPPKIVPAEPKPPAPPDEPAEVTLGAQAETGPATPTPGGFSSPLLRDIVPDEEALQGGFRSEILADVAPADAEPEPLAGFRSPLLAAMLASNDRSAEDIPGAPPADAPGTGEQPSDLPAPSPDDGDQPATVVDADSVPPESEAYQEAADPAATSGSRDR